MGVVEGRGGVGWTSVARWGGVGRHSPTHPPHHHPSHPHHHPTTHPPISPSNPPNDPPPPQPRTSVSGKILEVASGQILENPVAQRCPHVSPSIIIIGVLGRVPGRPGKCQISNESWFRSSLSQTGAIPSFHFHLPLPRPRGGGPQHPPRPHRIIHGCS